MNYLNELDALIEDIESQISDSENIPDKKGYDYIALQDFLKSISEKLKKEKYKLVFIGEKGIGKTTTILELFGLKIKKGIRNKKKEELLTTGGGGTTTCEVELLKSDKDITYFEIDPIDNQSFNQYIDDFCSIYDPNDNDNFNLPSEIKLSIKKMIDLKGNNFEKLYADCKGKEIFKKEIYRRIDLQKRTRTIINCDKLKGTFFNDCQHKFNEINLCKIKDVMLPKKIKIFLTKDIFDFDKYPFISSIIDTRGIDTILPEDADKMKREDILEYVDNDQNNCLFFFIDRLLTAPSQSICELLHTRLITGNEFRFYLLVNIRENEAEEVRTEDGKAETVLKGIEYKKEVIFDKFKQLNIRFSSQNLLFYNAKTNDPDNKTILNDIKKNIDKQKKYLCELIKESKKHYERLKYDFENKYALQNFEQIKRCVENVNTPDNVSDILIETFIGRLRNNYPARLHAINRNKGEYYAFNFFNQFSLIVENLFDKYFISSKDKIVNKVNEFKEYRNVTEFDTFKYRVFLERFENDYIEYRNQLKDEIKSEVKNNFLESTWKQAVDEWGRGPGYRKRVLEIYRQELTRIAPLINVRESYNSKWNKIIEENSLS